MEIEEKERFEAIDVMKCILIIFVIVGHNPNLVNGNIQRIIYWFHMPLFFIVGGYLFKSNHQKSWSRRTTLKYLIPYFSYFALDCLLQRNISINNGIKFLYGGRMYPGVYWFIPCMLLTLLIFHWLNRNFSNKTNLLIILIMYIAAHLESIFFLPYDGDYLNWNIIYQIPLNLDICLISIPYFAIGYYLKNIILKIVKKSNVISFFAISLICLAFIELNLSGILFYKLNMKLGHYYNFILDILIPVIFGIWILITSTLISKFISKFAKMLSIIGMNTLPIMYLHITINGLILRKINYGILMYIVIGIIPALIFNYICSKNRYLEIFFKGKMPNGII